MLGGTAGIVDVNLVLVCVDVRHVLADPPLLPATGYFIAALATFGIVPRHPSGDSCNRVLSNVLVISELTTMVFLIVAYNALFYKLQYFTNDKLRCNLCKSTF